MIRVFSRWLLTGFDKYDEEEFNTLSNAVNTSSNMINCCGI